MAVKKIQPKKPAARTRSASGSKAATKVSGRKTGLRNIRKTGKAIYRKSARKTGARNY